MSEELNYNNLWLVFSAFNAIFASISPEVQSVVLGRICYTGQETINRPWCHTEMFYSLNGDLLAFRVGLWVHFPCRFPSGTHLWTSEGVCRWMVCISVLTGVFPALARWHRDTFQRHPDGWCVSAAARAPSSPLLFTLPLFWQISGL